MLLKRKRVTAAKIETTVGDPIALAGADAAFNIYDTMVQANIDMEQRQGQGGFGMLPSVTAGLAGTATFRTMLEWSGTGVPLWADVFFPACGWVKTGTKFTPRTEAPGTNVKTLTLAVFGDNGAGAAVRKMLAGCAGSFVINAPTGRPAFIEWTFQGVWQPPSTETMLTPTYPTDLPLRFAGGIAEFDEEEMCVEQVTINSGNSVVMRECPTKEAGFISAIITDRVPTITANPEAVGLATQDRWAKWLAMTTHELKIEVGGPEGDVSDAAIVIEAPAAQITNNQEGDRNNMVTDEIEWQCNKDGADHDQELSIEFVAKVDS